jgi:hypothetical protein
MTGTSLEVVFANFLVDHRRPRVGRLKDLDRREGLLRRRAAILGLLVAMSLVSSAEAKDGYLSVTFTKVGLVGGVGAGRGVLTFEGREHPFTVYGLSLGVAIGGSVTHLEGRAAYMSKLSDFPGSYRAFGLGGALVGGAGGVQLKNKHGVIVTLEGPKAGMEFSANLSRVRFALD